jgi:capsular polysaccharide export protein
MHPAIPGTRGLSESAVRLRSPSGGSASVMFPELVGHAELKITPTAGAASARRRQVRLPGHMSIAGMPSVALAEGLLRAPPRGRAAPPCLSAVACEVSPAGWPSRIATPGQVLADRGVMPAALLARAGAARQALLAARVGGAWWEMGDLPRRGDYALVVLAEPTVPEGEAAPAMEILAAMLDAALRENPANRLLIVAPGTGREAAMRRLWPRLTAAATAGATLIRQARDPWLLLDRAVRVYGIGGEIGFLALLAGLPVSAFAPSFYTGWGATSDAPGLPTRPLRRSVDEIFAGCCLVATRYRDPFRDRPTTFEDAVAMLADWRRAEEANRRIAVCVGMSFWKRRRIAEFLRSSAGVPVFRRTVAGALAAAGRDPDRPNTIAGWASRLPDGLAETARRHQVPLIRVEDGFIRSVGLGSDFLPPASLVFDTSGMYFDPRSSDLERLLREAEFAPPLVARAARLTLQLVARGVTKYNLADRGPRITAPPGARRILVAGQVEDDLSVLHGAAAIRTNLDLLAAVRAGNRDAFILYKPHPDVVAGHRKGAIADGEARRFADAVVTDRSTAALLAFVDELHTITSLTGFEALLRGRRVVVYGRPFYAGWGLTVDRLPIDRGRRLTLDELVAGALILYPRYIDPLTRLPCGPEVVIERLDHPDLWRPGPLVLARRLQGAVTRRLGELRSMLSGPALHGARGLKLRPRQ